MYEALGRLGEVNSFHDFTLLNYVCTVLCFNSRSFLR